MKNAGKLVGIGLLGLFVLGGCVSGGGVSREAELSNVQRLERDVRVLSVEFALRNDRHRDVMSAAGRWIAGRFERLGYGVTLEPVSMRDGSEAFNVVAELRGTSRPDEYVIIGAHYDAEVTTAGADDNASGVAVLLELAARFAGAPQERTIRWVAFTNEENSNSAGGSMGSLIHALGCKERGEDVAAMLSLEMLGYFSDAPGSQRYPFEPEMAAKLGMELPTVGNYIGVVGRFADQALIERVSSAMSSTGTIPVTQAALPPMVPAIYRSDHANFWMQGYPAAMVTDTSEYRNPNYHAGGDLWGTLDYERMAGVVEALEAGVRGLGNCE